MNAKSHLSRCLKKNSFPSMNSKTCQWCTGEYKRGNNHETSKDEKASSEIGFSVLSHQIHKGFRGGHAFFL